MKGMGLLLSYPPVFPIQAVPTAISILGTVLAPYTAQNLFIQTQHPWVLLSSLCPTSSHGKCMDISQPNPATCKLQLTAQPCDIHLLMSFI